VANYNSMLSQMQQSNTLQNTILNAFVGNIMKEIFQDVDPSIRYANQLANQETIAMSQAGQVAIQSLKTFNTNFPASLTDINNKWNDQATYDKYESVSGVDAGGKLIKVDEQDPLYGVVNMALINQGHYDELSAFLTDNLGSWDANAKKGTGLSAGIIEYRDPLTGDWKEEYNPNVQKFAQATRSMMERMSNSSMKDLMRGQQQYVTSEAYEKIISNSPTNLSYDINAPRIKSLIDATYDRTRESDRMGIDNTQSRQDKLLLEEMEKALEVYTKIGEHDTKDDAGIQLDESKYKNMTIKFGDTDDDKQLQEILSMAGVSGSNIKNINGQTEVPITEAARAIDYFVGAKDFDNAKMILDKFIGGTSDRATMYNLREKLRKDTENDYITAYNGRLAPYTSALEQGVATFGKHMGAIGFIDKDGAFGVTISDLDQDEAARWKVLNPDIRDTMGYFTSLTSLQKMNRNNFSTFDEKDVLGKTLSGAGTKLLDTFLLAVNGGEKENQQSTQNWKAVKFDNKDYVLHRTGDNPKPTGQYADLKQLDVNSLNINQMIQVLDTYNFGQGPDGAVIGIEGLTNPKNYPFLSGIMKLGNVESEANNGKNKALTAFPRQGMAYKEIKSLVKMGDIYKSLNHIYGTVSDGRQAIKALDKGDAEHNNAVYNDEFTNQYADGMKAHNIGNVRGAKNNENKAWYESDWDGTTALNLTYNDKGFINGGEGFNSAKATWYLLGHHAYNNEYSIADLANKGGWTADNKEAWIKNVSSHLGVMPDSKVSTLELGDVVKAIGIAEGTLTKDSVIPTLEQLGGSEAKLMAKVHSHPSIDKPVEPPIEGMEQWRLDNEDAMKQAKKVHSIQTTIDLLENEMGLPLSQQLNELDTLLDEKEEGWGNAQYFVSDGRAEWKDAVKAKDDLAKKFYSEAKRGGFVGFKEMSIIGSEVDEAEEMMTDYNRKGSNSKYDNPTLERILIDYNEASAKVDSITEPLRALLKKEDKRGANPRFFEKGLHYQNMPDNNMFDDLAMTENEVKKAGFLYSGQSTMGRTGDKEKMATSPEERARWTSRSDKTRDRIHELSKDIAAADPNSGTPNSFKSRLAALNNSYSKERQELVGFNLKGDEEEAIALLELLTEEAALAAR